MGKLKREAGQAGKSKIDAKTHEEEHTGKNTSVNYASMHSCLTERQANTCTPVHG